MGHMPTVEIGLVGSWPSLGRPGVRSIPAHSPALRALCGLAPTYLLCLRVESHLFIGPSSFEGLIHGTRLQADGEHCVIDFLQGPQVAEGGVGAVAVRQGEEHGVIGQEDQPSICQALGPRSPQQGCLLGATQER